MMTVHAPTRSRRSAAHLRRGRIGWLAVVASLLMGCGARTPLTDVRYAPDFGGAQLEGPITVLPITGYGVRSESEGVMRRTLLALRPDRDYRFVPGAIVSPAHEAILMALGEQRDPAPADVLAVADGAPAVLVLWVESGTMREETNEESELRERGEFSTWVTVEYDRRIVLLNMRLLVLEGHTGRVLLSARDAVEKTRVLDQREASRIEILDAFLDGLGRKLRDALGSEGPTLAEEIMIEAIERLSRCLPLPGDEPGVRPGGICGG